MAASPQGYRPIVLHLAAMRVPDPGQRRPTSRPPHRDGRHDPPLRRVPEAASRPTVTAPLAACGLGPDTLSGALYGSGYPQYTFGSGYRAAPAYGAVPLSWGGPGHRITPSCRATGVAPAAGGTITDAGTEAFGRGGSRSCLQAILSRPACASSRPGPGSPAAARGTARYGCPRSPPPPPASRRRRSGRRHRRPRARGRGSSRRS